MDYFEKRILLFEYGKAEPRIIARHGSGPGEIGRANYLFRFQDKLFVLSASFFQSFDIDSGAFLERVRIRPGHNINKTNKGWLVTRWDHQVKRTGLFLADERLNQTEALVHWQERLSGAQFLTPGTTVEIEVFKDVGSYAVSQDGGRVFYRHPNQATVHIYDMEKEEIIGQIVLQDRYLFSKSKGEESIARIQSASPRCRVIGKFPKFFPYTSGIFSDKENHFIIRRFKANQETLLRFDRDGRPLPEPELNLEQMKRVLAKEGDSFYVSFQNREEGDMGISRVPKHLLKTFIENHPID